MACVVLAHTQRLCEPSQHSSPIFKSIYLCYRKGDIEFQASYVCFFYNLHSGVLGHISVSDEPWLPGSPRCLPPSSSLCCEKWPCTWAGLVAEMPWQRNQPGRALWAQNPECETPSSAALPCMAWSLLVLGILFLLEVRLAGKHLSSPNIKEIVFLMFMFPCWDLIAPNCLGFCILKDVPTPPPVPICVGCWPLRPPSCRGTFPAHQEMGREECGRSLGAMLKVPGSKGSTVWAQEFMYRCDVWVSQC